MKSAPQSSPGPDRAGLQAILAPQSIAVIGASQDPRKRGHRAIRALLESGFKGSIHPVNPKGGELLGLTVASSVADIDVTPDLAFICTSAASVPEVLAQCAARGIPGAVVPAVGFRETGVDGAMREAQMVQIAREGGLRLVGPNTSGVLVTASGLNLVGVNRAPAGPLAILSQSGNVALNLIQRAGDWNTGISVYVGVGNESDIAFHEYLEYLDHDPHTRAILMYVEGFRDGRQFIQVARRVTRSKPIVLLKGGRSERGVIAARSHTGAIAGSYPVLRAALRRGGVSEVLRSDELLPVGMALVGQPPVPVGTDVVVLTDGGGHATLAVDELASLSVPLATLTDETIDQLRDALGVAATVSNPIDLAGAADTDPTVFPAVLEILVRDPSVGAILTLGLFGGYHIRFEDSLARAEEDAAGSMIEIMSRAGKALVVHSLYADDRPAAIQTLLRGGVPVVGSVEVACRCMRALQARGLHLAEQPVPKAVRPLKRTAPVSITFARRERRTALMETETRDLLEAYDVPVVDAIACRTLEEALAAAASMDGPVALKAVSPAITHKTDAGALALNLSGPEAVTAAFASVMGSASRFAIEHGATPDIRSVLVVPMLPEPVAELIVGVHQDPNFGPVLTVGAGGVNVEIHHDAALRDLPIGRGEVLEMLNEIRLARILNGYRGRPAASHDALTDTIMAIAGCALDYAEIEELEANPVFAYPDRAVVVDARAFVRDPTAAD
jgi:acetyltransferase